VRVRWRGGPELPGDQAQSCLDHIAPSSRTDETCGSGVAGETVACVEDPIHGAVMQVELVGDRAGFGAGVAAGQDLEDGAPTLFGGTGFHELGGDRLPPGPLRQRIALLAARQPLVPASHRRR
jgi:hypothetical protein